MGATGQITVSSITPTAVQAKSGCKKIRITENLGVSGWPTTDFLIYKGSVSATPVRIPAGSAYIFEFADGVAYGYFGGGAIAGYVQTVSGTTTFDQDESSAV